MSRPADGDLLQPGMGMGEGGVVIDGSLDQFLQALGRYRHASSVARRRVTRAAPATRRAGSAVPPRLRCISRVHDDDDGARGEAGEEAEAGSAGGAGADDNQAEAEAAADHRGGHQPAAAGAARQGRPRRPRRGRQRENRPRPGLQREDGPGMARPVRRPRRSRDLRQAALRPAETHGPSARLAVVAVATSLPPDGETAWSQAAIARRLGERGLDISRAAVGRVLAEAHVRPHKVRAGSTGPTTRPSGRRPGRSAAST